MHYPSWKVVKKLVRNELRYLTNVFTAQDIPYPIESVPPVDLMTKTYEGYRYLFVANPSCTTKFVELKPIFQFREDRSIICKNIEVEVMFENRKLNVDSLILRDTIDSWSVHVYRWSLLRLNFPTSLTASTLFYFEVKLEWCDNSKKNTGYEIWYKPAGGEWQVDTVSDTTCAIVDNLDYHKEYYFKVRAIDDKGHASAFSDSVKCQPNYFYPVNDLKAHQIVERILKIEWDYDKLHNGFYIYGQRHLYPGEPANGDFFSAFVPADSFSYSCHQ